MIWKMAGVLLLIMVMGAAYLFISYRQSIGEAERAWSSMKPGALTGERIFDPKMVEGQWELPSDISRTPLLLDRRSGPR